MVPSACSINANYKLPKKRKEKQLASVILAFWFLSSLFSVAFMGLCLWNKAKPLWKAIPPPCLYNPIPFTWLRRGSPVLPTSLCPMQRAVNSSKARFLPGTSDSVLRSNALPSAGAAKLVWSSLLSHAWEWS